jgi:hypothetical protein
MILDYDDMEKGCDGLKVGLSQALRRTFRCRPIFIRKIEGSPDFLDTSGHPGLSLVS